MKLSDWMTANEIKDGTLAAKVGADRSLISRLRRGLTKPSWELAGRIKAATGGEVGADDFLPAEAAE